MTWWKEQIITVFFLVLFPVQWWPATVLGRWESGFSYPFTSACFHVQKGSSSLKVTVTSCLLGQKEQLQRRKVLFFVPAFPAWMPGVTSQLTICPVLLSVKWWNTAYLIRMLQELYKSFGNALQIENANILPDEVISHTFGWLVFFMIFVGLVGWFVFLPDSSPECTSKQES